MIFCFVLTKAAKASSLAWIREMFANLVASSSHREKPQTLEIVSKEQEELGAGKIEHQVVPLEPAFLAMAFSWTSTSLSWILELCLVKQDGPLSETIGPEL